MIEELIITDSKSGKRDYIITFDETKFVVSDFKGSSSEAKARQLLKNEGYLD